MDALTHLALTTSLSRDETRLRIMSVGYSEETQLLLADWILSGLMNAGLYDATETAVSLAGDRNPLLRMVRASQALVGYTRGTLGENTKEGNRMREALREFLCESLSSEFGIRNLLDDSFSWCFWKAVAGDVRLNEPTKRLLLEVAQAPEWTIRTDVLEDFVIDVCLRIQAATLERTQEQRHWDYKRQVPQDRLIGATPKQLKFE